jgi:hypothetical protein
VAHDFDVAAETLEPSGDVVRVGDGAGEEEELELERCGEEGSLVVVAAGSIGEPVIFVDDEEVEATLGALGIAPRVPASASACQKAKCAPMASISAALASEVEIQSRTLAVNICIFTVSFLLCFSFHLT